MRPLNEATTPLSRRRSIQALGSESICAVTDAIPGRISHNDAMKSALNLFAVSGLLLLGACSKTEPVVLFEPQALDVPARVPATGPRISGDQGTSLILSWMEPDEEDTSLKYSRYQDGQWLPAKIVVEGHDMFVNWADMPSVTPLGDGRLAAHWLQMSADLPYAYDIVYTQSGDDGVTWSEPLRPHNDGTPTEHGFVSIFPNGSHTGLIWLDGRRMVNEETNDALASGMTLRSAFVDENLTLHREQLVDDLICDCCQTDVALAVSGPVAVYRDRTRDEIRDIYVTRFADGGWLPGKPVADDNWEIPGCPVNGPAIAANGKTVAVAWFTGAADHPVVRLSFSDDGGETFSAPIEVIDGSVLGRVGVLFLDDDDVAVSWLQPGNGGKGDVHVRSIGKNGTLGVIHTVSTGAASFSVPQIARSGDDLVIVWTESEDFVDRIASARVPVAAL